MDNDLDRTEAGAEQIHPELRQIHPELRQKQPQLRVPPEKTDGVNAGEKTTNAGEKTTRGRGVVSVLSLAASALAVLCFVTGRTTLSSFFSPGSVPPATVASAPPTQTQIEQLFSQSAFFIHYGHLPGQGTDDYDADDTEEERQKLIAGLERCIVSSPAGLPGKASGVDQKTLARAQSLRYALAQMKPGDPLNQ